MSDLESLPSVNLDLQTVERKQPIAGWKFFITVATIFGFIAPLFYFGLIIFKKPEDYALTVVIILTGGALGWVIGIFLSPMPDEKDQFQSYAKATAAGISGYALAKIDPILSSLLIPNSVNLENSFRFLAFTVAFIVPMLATFAWRRYT